MNILILGAAQHAKIVVSLLKTKPRSFTIIGYLDDDESLHGKKILGYPVLGHCALLPQLVKKHFKNIDSIAVGISNRYMMMREKIFKLATELRMHRPSLIHPHAYVSPFAKIGKGCIINPGVVVNAYATIGNNCVLYSNSSIEHECRLDDNVYMGPGVNLAANIQVGKNTFIGTGSNIIPHIKIGSHVTIGAGSVVIKNVPSRYTAVGAPSKLLHRALPKF